MSFDAGIAGTAGAAQYYAAMERLFALRESPRRPTANAVSSSPRPPSSPHLRPPAAELTWLFERARYGGMPPGAGGAPLATRPYRVLFRDLG